MSHFYPGLSSRGTTRCLLAAMCTLVTATMVHAMDAPPEMVVGDKWTFKEQSKADNQQPYLVKHEVKAVENGSAWIYGESSQTNAPLPRFMWRYDVKRAEFVERFENDPAAPNGAGKRQADRQTNDALVQFPLAVGKKYKVKRLWDNGNGFDEFTAEVQALEKVKVEAGEFDAYRIHYTGYWNQRVGGNWSGRVDWVRWYAPSVRREVRSEYKSRTSHNQANNHYISELVKWEPAAPK